MKRLRSNKGVVKVSEENRFVWVLTVKDENGEIIVREKRMVPQAIMYLMIIYARRGVRHFEIDVEKSDKSE